MRSTSSTSTPSHAPLLHPKSPVPMVVLAFLTGPDAVAKILRHLGLPTGPPPLSQARSPASRSLPMQQLPPDSSPPQEKLLPQADGDTFADRVEQGGAPVASPSTIRPPP